MGRTPYQRTSETDEALAKKFKKLFRQNRLTWFDELGIMQTKKHIIKLYGKLEKIMFQEFYDVAKVVHKEVKEDLIAMGFVGTSEEPSEEFIKSFFKSYSPTMQYVLLHEIARKQSYLFEALVSDGTRAMQAYQKSEKYFTRMTSDYFIELEDSVALKVYDDFGITEFEWVAEIDIKTCDICESYSGEIFSRNEIPTKPHRGCRCYILPIR